MIRISTAGLDDYIKPLGFAKATNALIEEWEDGNTVTVKDSDTDIPLYLPGFESARFKGLWSKINKKLVEMQHGKCAYCEAKMAATSQADVEHFRPKAGYDPATGGVESAMLGARGIVRSGYFWLAYNAGNYYAACRICNEVYKKNKFDLMPGSPRATYGKPAREQPAFVDPGAEDPRLVLRFDPYTAKAVPSKLWDEYIRRKGENDPLVPRPVPVLAQLSKSQLQSQQDTAQAICSILWNAAREVCVAVNKQDPRYLLQDLSLRATYAEQRKGEFTWDNPVRDQPYQNYAQAGQGIIERGPQAMARYFVLAWLFEVDPNSQHFVILTNVLASSLKLSDQHALAARQYVESCQKSLVLSPVDQLLATDGQTSRAVYCIIHLGLNRTELIRARAEHLMKIRALFLFLKNNGLTQHELEAMLNQCFAKDPVDQVSDAPDELDAAMTALGHAVSRAGQFASATLDALLAWRVELPLARPTPHNILTTQGAPSEPWLARYYRLAIQPLQPDTEDDEDQSDDSDNTLDTSDPDPSTQKLTPADCGYFCALQRFGVRLALLRSRFGLSVPEGDILSATVLKNSSKPDEETELLFAEEVRRLLAYHATPEDIVEKSYIPAWAGTNAKGYWAYVDKQAKNTDRELEKAYAALAKAQGSKHKPAFLDKAAVKAWWKKAYPKKKTYPKGLT